MKMILNRFTGKSFLKTLLENNLLTSILDPPVVAKEFWLYGFLCGGRINLLHCSNKE